MNAAATPTGELLGHPKGLYVCFLTEMWERFAFYGMKALLLLYLIQHHKFADADGYILLGTYAGLAYALPLIGGLLADRWLGMRKAVVFGGLLLVFGQLGMAYTGSPAEGTPGNAVADTFAIQVMYFSLALIGVGVGFLKPNISTIVGRLYRDDDPRRDSGFTIFYMGINIGAMLSSLVVGWIGFEIGWGWGFALAGVLMLFGLLQFLWGQKHLQGHAEPPDMAALKAPVFAGLSREWLIYLGGVITTVAMWKVLQTKLDFDWLSKLAGGHPFTLTELVAFGLGAALLIWFLFFLFSGISALERGRMIVLMTLIVISAFFWGLYEQTYGTWVALTDRGMTKELFPGFATATEQPFPWSVFSLVVVPIAFLLAMKIAGERPASRAPFALVTAAMVVVLVFLLHDILIVKQTAGSLTFLGALFVVLLTPVFAWLWPQLDRLGINPSHSAKFGLGLLFCGLSMGVLAYATGQPDPSTGLVSVWWLVLAYFVLVLGEMVLSPIGLSAVTTLSVPRVVGMMMGAWFLASAFGEMIAGRLGTLAAIEPNQDGTYDVAAALQVYAKFFTDLMWIGLALGILMLLLTPLMKRLVRPRD